MNQIAKKEETGGEVVAMSESGKILEIITKMASSDQIDPERLGKMMDLYERVQATRAKGAFTTALAELQPKLPVITERGEIKNGNKVQSRYAYYEDIIEAIGPKLAEHGFAVTFRPGFEGERQVVTGVLKHREGHEETATVYLPTDTGPGRNAVQAVASSLSYGKRYALCALLNITTRGEDDDGNKAGASYITKAQREEIVGMLDEVATMTGQNEAEILCRDFLQVPSVSEIPSNLYDKARHGIKTKLARLQKEAKS